MTSARRARIFIDTLLSENKVALDSAYTVLQVFQQQNKVLELENQAKALVESAVAAGAELSKAEIELSVAQQQYQSDAPAIDLLRKRFLRFALNMQKFKMVELPEMLSPYRFQNYPLYPSHM